MIRGLALLILDRWWLVATGVAIGVGAQLILGPPQPSQFWKFETPFIESETLENSPDESPQKP